MMEYNNYYPVHPGRPPPSSNMINTQTDCSSMSGYMMTPNGPSMMQPSPTPSTPHSMRQTPSPSTMQAQQLMGTGSHMHQHQQPSPHPVYHQLPPHPPMSHSASPHPSSTPHSQQPPPRPSTGPSPLNHQSPIHMNGPSPKLHPVGSLGPPSQAQTTGVVGPTIVYGQAMSSGAMLSHHQAQNYVGNQVSHHSSPQYGHSSMNQHQQNSTHQSMQHHGSQTHSHQQPGPHQQHTDSMGARGQQAHSSMPLHQSSQTGYVVSSHPTPPPMHHQQHHHSVSGFPPPLERGSPFYQQIPQTEFRIIKLNKRLQNRPRPLGPPKTLPIDDLDESRWWKQFACDFFDDDATLSLRIPGEHKPTDYTIGRTMIPRFFKSYFDGGVMDFSIKLRNIRETTHQSGSITLDCDQTDITTKNFFRHQGANPPLSVIVHTEGHLSVDFVNNGFDNLLVKSWRFYANQCHEYVDRSMTSAGMANTYLSEPVTRFGLTKNTVKFLKMCMIMEPMQDLMVQQRQSNMKPKACLKHFLFDRYQYKNIDDIQTQPNKRRRRKAADGPSSGATKKSKANSNGVSATVSQLIEPENNMAKSGDGGVVLNIPITSQDVLVVGEPMLGADFGDENERRATRLENSQYENLTSMEAKVDSSQPINQNSIAENAGRVADNNQTAGQSTNSSSQQEQRKQITEDADPSKQSIIDQVKLQENDCRHETSSDSLPLNNPNDDTGKNSNKSNFKCNIDEKREISGDQAIATSSSSKDTSSPVSNIDSSNDQNISNDECHDEPPRPVSNGPVGKENNNKELTIAPLRPLSTGPAGKENNNEESPTTISTDSLKLIATGSSKAVGIVPSNKQNRRRSSERKETLREGLMRTSDFVVAMKDLKLEHPSLWRITTGNNLLQQFEPKIQNGVILFENTNQYAGWNPEIRKDYVGVDVRLTQHTRNQITVERLLLNFQNIEHSGAFYDRHFAIYLQILISTTLDPKFWDGIESELKHHDYFITSRKIIEDIIKRYKLKLTNRLKLSDYSLKDFEKYPNLITKPIDINQDKAPMCRSCNSPSTQQVSFENRSYDLFTFKPVKVTNEVQTKEQHYNLCDGCYELVKLFSDVHHIGWKFFNLAREKADLHRAKGKPIDKVLDECLKDEDWMTKIFKERDSIFSKVDQLQ